MVDQIFRGLPVPENVIRKRRFMFLIGIVIIIVAIIGLVIFLTGDKETVTEDINIDNFQINKAVLANSVGDDFVYTEKSGEEYNIGEPITMYLESVGYPTYQEGDKYLVSSSFNVVMIDADGYSIATHTGNVVSINDFMDDKSLLKYSGVLDSSSLEPGEYKLEFEVTDDITNTRRTVTKDIIVK
ncbi:MAG: hypothetical protein U9R08_03045 [Nanoarchaeota archaeon]|nr:hypothetical protein [Nanoarchaeota archaeon]